MDQAAVWSFWGPLFTIALILAIRLRRAARERPFTLRRWWLVPLLFTGLVGLLLALAPPAPLGWVAFVGALAPGALVGWHRGKLTSLRLHQAGWIVQQTSPLSVLLLIGIVVARMAVRQLWGGPPGEPHPVLAATIVTDALLGLALAMVVVGRVEVMLRARALLAKGAGRP